MDEKESKQLQQCRFYEQKFPTEEDLVVVEIVNVEENAVYVHLLEYNKIEGMITPNELTKPMQQSMHKALKIGKQEVVRVIRIDQVKGYIDLSKKRVQKQEELQCLDKFAKSKQVNSILITVSEKTKTKLDVLYEEVVWPLYKICQHPLQAFTQALTDQQIINDLKTSQENKDALMSQIHLRLTPQTLKIRADFELSCDEFEGIESIKQALRAGQEKSVLNCEVRFSIIGSPLYCGQINTQNKTLGLQVINDALKRVEETIVKLKGAYKLKSEPKVYGDTKENDMEYIEQNEEEQLNSDDSNDSEIEGMGVVGVESGDEESKGNEDAD